MQLPRARSSVIVQEDSEDFFLVDTEGGEVFQINATAARIFSLCQRGASLDDAIAALAEGLSIDGQEALIREDVEETAKTLVALGLCEAPAAP